MIYESCYWKDDLLREAKRLRLRLAQRRWSERSLARVEQCLMLGFYAIRKLIESKKIADDLARQTLTLTAYPVTGKSVTHMNWHRIDELYLLDAPQTVSRDLTFLCNQFVHSYVFIPSFDEAGGLTGVLLSSDRERRQLLYFVALDEVIRVFEQVGNDYPNEVHMVFDPAIRDYRVASCTLVGECGLAD